MAHKFKPGDYVRFGDHPRHQVAKVLSVTPSGLPRVSTPDGPVAIRGGEPATEAEHLEWLETRRLVRARRTLRVNVSDARDTEPGDQGRDEAARAWLAYRGWTVTPPVAKDAT